MIKNDEKIKYAFLTTVPASLEAFIMPFSDKLNRDKYQITLISNMDDDFIHENSERYICKRHNLSRGFHFVKTIIGIIQLYKLFKKERYDIIEYATENVAFCASIAGRLAGIPIRLYDHWGARYVGLNGVSKKISIIIEKTTAKCSTDIRQVSNLNKEMCIRDGLYPESKVKVLGKGGTVGVDFCKFDLSRKEEWRSQVRDEYGISNNALLFGFVGRIQKDKGVNELLDAFKAIVDFNPNCYLMLVGEMDSTIPVDSEKITWAKNCENVIIVGKVKDVFRYLSSFDVLVHPTYREGFGMVLQEAGAMKVATITTDILGPCEFIENGSNGLLVEAKNVTELREAMLFLLNDASERNRLAENDYDYTKAYFERTIMVQRIISDREDIIYRRL